MVSATLSRLAAPLVCLCALLLLIPITAEAQEAPRVLSYQGQLLEDETTPVEGPQEVTFRLHRSPTGSATVGAWEETRTVEPVNGVFSVLLGETNDLPTDLTSDAELYLGVSVNGTEIDRVRLTSTVFALSAARAGLAEIAERAEVADIAESVETRAVDTGALADEAVTGSKIADGAVVRRLSIQQGGSTVANLRDEVSFIEGDNVSFSTNDGALTISAAAPDGGLSSVSSDGTLTGDGTSSDPLGVDVIGSSNLLEGAVGNRELATDAVSSSRIQNAAVTASKLREDAAVLQLNSLTGALSLRSTDNSLGISSSGEQIDLSLAEGAAVRALNELSGSVSLLAGSNVTIATDDDSNELTIGVETEGLTGVSTDDTMTGDGSEDAPLGIAEDGVGRDELASGVAVDRLNSLRGDVTIAVDGGAGISTDSETNTITITAGSGGDGDSGIQSISNTDGALSIQNGSGPSTTINVQNEGIETSMLDNRAVTSDKIESGAVESRNIGDGEVIAGKIATEAVSESNLQNNSVTTAKIVSGAVTQNEIASNSVGSSQIISGAVGRSELSDDAAVLSLETPAGNTLRGGIGVIAGENIVISDNADDQLTIATSGDVLTSIITDASLAGTGTSDSNLRIATDGVSGSNIQDGAVGSGEIANNTVVRTLEYQNNGGSTTGPFRDVITLNAGSNLTISDDGGSTLTIDADLEGASVLTDVTIDGDGTEGSRLSLADDAVSESKIQDGAVTGVKAVSEFMQAGTNISVSRDGNDNFVVAAPDVLTEVTSGNTLSGVGTTNSPLDVADNSIGSAQLQSGAVGSEELQGDAAVLSLNELFGSVELVGGGDVDITDDGNNTITISVDAPEGGLTSVETDGVTIDGDGTDEQNAISIVDGGVGSDQLADDTAVRSLNGLQDGITLAADGLDVSDDEDANTITFSIADAAVGEDQLADDTVIRSITADGETLFEGVTFEASGDADISVSENTITFSATSEEGGLQTVNVDETTILGDGTDGEENELRVGTIGSEQIEDNAITSDELGPNAVEAINIAPGAVDNDALGLGVVERENIAADAVGSGQLDENAAVTGLRAEVEEEFLTSGVTLEGGTDIELAQVGQTITINSTAPGNGSETGVETLNGLDGALDLDGDGIITVTAVEAMDTIELAVASNSIGEGALADGAVTEGILADGAVTAAKLDNQAAVLDLRVAGEEDGLVGTPALEAGDNITLSQNNTANTITINATTSGGPAGVESLNTLTGALTISGVEGIGGIDVTESGDDITLAVSEDAITAAELATDAVQAANLATGAVGTDALATDAVTTAKILNDAITAAKIATDQVTTTELATDAVQEVNILNGAVTAGKLSADAAVLSISDGTTIDEGALTFDSSDDSIDITVDGTGTVNFAAATGSTSAARYKEAVEKLENPAELLARLRGVRYQWVDDGRADVGMIADEVAEVLPELVTFNDAGEPERLHYSRLVAVLVEAAKEQQAEIEAQQEQMEEMEERIARLERMVTQMAEAGN